jgi:hemin uptake protein HemP
MTRHDEAQVSEGSKASVPARIDLAKLIQGAREVILVHEGQDYRLRITAKGKLILTK